MQYLLKQIHAGVVGSRRKGRKSSMVRYQSRVALLLCLLLVLHEFGPARLANIKPLSDSTLDEVAEEPGQEDQEQESDLGPEARENKPIDDKRKHEQEKHHGNKEHEKNEHEKGSRRGFGSVITNIIKVAKTGNEIISKMVLVATVSNTIFRAIAGCCADYPEACEGNEEISEHRTNISSKTVELDNIQLEAKNLQEWTESTSDEFATVLFKLNTIVDNADTLVRKMSPAVQEAIERQTTQIKQLVRKNKESGKELGFLEAQEMYDSAIKIALGITIPVITGVIPTIPKLIKFAQTKMGLRGSYTLDHSVDNALKKPPTTSSKAKVLKSWLAKPKAIIDAKLKSFMTKLNTKYGGAVKVMKNLGSGLTLILGYVGSAYGIYSIIQSVQSCKEKQDKVIEALKEYRKVDKELDGSILKAKEAKQLVQEAWENMKKDLTSPEFIDDLKEVKNVILSLSTQSQDLKTAAEKVQSYIEKAEVVDGYEELYHIIRDLSEGLGSIPFTIDCYTEKVQMTDYVLRECKRGTDSFEALYSQGLEQFDTNAKNCEKKIGYAHIEEPSIKLGLAELAEKENFKEDCILNSPLRKSLACGYKNKKYSNKEIADMMEGVSEEQVENLTQACPKPSFSPAERKTVCEIRKLDKDITDKKIAETLGLSVDDVKSVPKDISNCNDLLTTGSPN